MDRWAVGAADSRSLSLQRGPTYLTQERLILGIFLNAWQTNGTTSLNRLHWEVNRDCYIECNPKRDPILVTLYKAQNTSVIRRYINYTRASENGGFDRVNKIYPVKRGTTIEVVFQLMGSKNATQIDLHPWHVHGQDFYDLGAGPGKCSEEALQGLIATRRPIQRDTTVGYSAKREVSLESGEVFVFLASLIQNEEFIPYGWRVIRFKADNAGVWMVVVRKITLI